MKKNEVYCEKTRKIFKKKIDKINELVNDVILWEEIFVKKTMEYNEDKVEHKAEICVISGVVKQKLKNLKNLSKELFDDVRESKKNSERREWLNYDRK